MLLDSFRATLVGVAALFFAGSSLAAPTPVPLGDLDGTPESSRACCLRALGDRWLFFATRGGHEALWRTDGTEEGTRVIGPERYEQEHAVELERIGDLLFFTRGRRIIYPTDFPHARALWRSDGTDEGTFELHPETFEEIAALTVLDDVLYFWASTEAAGNELWRSDGTEEGTRPAFELCPGSCGQQGFRTTRIGDRIVFVTQEDDGSRLWVTDGTAAGTVTLRDDLPEVSSSVRHPMDVRAGRAFFRSLEGDDSGDFFYSLWVTDGTRAGTEQLLRSPANHWIEIGPAVGESTFFTLRPLGSFPPRATSLWVTDGTRSGTRQVVSSPEDIGLYILDATDDALFFAVLATADSYEASLWRTDATAAVMTRIVDLTAPFSLGVVGDKLYFSADDGVAGSEPWRTDGTAAGTFLLADLEPGPGSSSMRALAKTDDLVLLDVVVEATGREPWAIDVATDSVRPLGDLFPGPRGSFPFVFGNDGETLFFAANDGVRGFEPYLLDTFCAFTGEPLLLRDGRFRVDVCWRDTIQNRGTGPGHPMPLTPDTGYFWFSRDSNVELVLKVLDGRASNGHFWVFYGALSNLAYKIRVIDRETGAVKVYRNPGGRFASVGDVTALSGDGVAAEAPADVVRAASATAAASAGGDCVPGPANLCLQGGRFRVEVLWNHPVTGPAAATAEPLTPDTGYFWFGRDSNVELVLKVLDGRRSNGHFWVFYGALSNLEYTVTVTDTATGDVRVYHNPPGRFASVGDGRAF